MKTFIISLFFLAAATTLASGAEAVLEDASLLVAFDTETGALIRLVSKTTDWTVQRRPELGVSFRMHAPLPKQRYNFVYGQKQKARKVEKISNSEIRLEWDNLKSENGGVLPITLYSTVTLRDGILTFDATIENRSKLTIETIDYPYFGDFNPPAKDARMNVRTMWYGNLQQDEIYPSFNNGKGYWGVFVPTKTFDSFRSLFCLIQTNKGHGLYVEMHDPTQPYLLEYTFEQHPGVLRGDAPAVPQTDEISGYPVHLDFRTCHFIFTKPGATKQLVPIRLRAYQGDWQQGVDYYKQWRAEWFKPAHTPAWLHDVHSWLQLQINSAEEDFRVPYKELVKYGEECAANGVTAIQLVGWQQGGQDRGDPYLRTDPAMGTFDELKQAVADIEKTGVRMIMFGGKPNFADKTTDWYRKELYKYAATDPYGIPYEHGSYSYYTPTQLSGINNRRRAVMDFLAPAFRESMAKEFQKLLDLNASGWLFDENCHHGNVKYSFATNHGYEAPGYIYGGDIPLAARLRAEADKRNPDFVFAGEGHQDWLMQYYPCSYFRINNGSTAVDRYIDPYAPLVVAVTGIDDREKLNLILMGRYIISYEPFNFKGHVTDFAPTLEYGKKIDNLRRKYRDYLWDAEYRDVLGAEVKADGACRYSVFTAKSGKRAVVVVNPSLDRTVSAEVKLPSPGALSVATPEEPLERPLSGALTVPPRSAAVVIER